MNNKDKNAEPETEMMISKPGSVHKGHRHRMKQRFDETGFNGWSKHEVMEYMLYYVYRQQNTNEIAHMMVNNAAGSLTRLFQLAQTDVLQKINNVGPKTVDYLRTLKAFMDYYHNTVITERSMVFNRENFSTILKLMDFSDQTEELMIICLTRNMRVKYITGISHLHGEGYVITKPQSIMRIAMATGAHRLVLVHNHPSGSLSPSQEDVMLTRNAEDMLSQVGIRLLEHYIVCGEKFIGIKTVLNIIGNS